MYAIIEFIVDDSYSDPLSKVYLFSARMQILCKNIWDTITFCNFRLCKHSYNRFNVIIEHYKFSTFVSVLRNYIKFTLNNIRMKTVIVYSIIILLLGIVIYVPVLYSIYTVEFAVTLFFTIILADAIGQWIRKGRKKEDRQE